MTAPDKPAKVGRHAAWAMAVGGMVGGGMYTLVGMLFAYAGALAWLSISIGATIALATVHSYAHLAATTKSSGVPVTIFAREGHHKLARGLSWWLLAVYVLALGVYTFTAGHYLGRALGVGSLAIAGLELAMVSALVVLNVLAVNNPIALQIGAVWLQLVILAGVAIAGLVDFRVDALGAPGTLAGVIQAAALTFVAFEGFEMIAYDLRELRKPRRVMQRALPAAVIAVATAYVLVALGAASLVGADALIAHEDAALAVAGRAVAGTPGMIIVTLAACVAALTAVNATLFSAARLARTSAEHGLLPDWCAHCNRHSAPTWSTVVIGVGAFAFAATMPLELLVGLASIGFLGLFCLVNAVAFRRKTRRRFIAAFGALTSAAGVAVITWTYAS